MPSYVTLFCRNKRQNIKKRLENTGTSQETNNGVSQLASTATTNKEFEIPESQSEVPLRYNLPLLLFIS